MTIKQLFDPSKNINRSIEKVITYGVSQETRLKSEISEYVVTDSIDQQFEGESNAPRLRIGADQEFSRWALVDQGLG